MVNTHHNPHKAKTPEVNNSIHEISKTFEIETIVCQ